jgi:hypothetical protein
MKVVTGVCGLTLLKQNVSKRDYRLKWTTVFGSQRREVISRFPEISILHPQPSSRDREPWSRLRLTVHISHNIFRLTEK